jgi:hypothetical protein
LSSVAHNTRLPLLLLLLLLLPLPLLLLPPSLAPSIRKLTRDFLQ